MATQCGQDRYIKCKGCKCKYINNDECIKQGFGYNILGEQLKTCVKCRSCSNKYKEQAKQQSIYTNANTLCSTCYTVKPNYNVGEYKTFALNKDSNKFQEVMLSYKTCDKCREQCKQYQADNHDLDKTNQRQQSYRERLLQKEVDNDTEQICTICYKVKPKSVYGEYKTWAFNQDTSPVQEVMLSYKSCKGCRDRDKKYNNNVTTKEDTSDDEYDNDCYNDCYHDGCVEYDYDGDMFGFR